jgi:hypothetical protein
VGNRKKVASTVDQAQSASVLTVRVERNAQSKRNRGLPSLETTLLLTEPAGINPPLARLSTLVDERPPTAAVTLVSGPRLSLNSHHVSIREAIEQIFESKSSNHPVKANTRTRAENAPEGPSNANQTHVRAPRTPQNQVSETPCAFFGV